MRVKFPLNRACPEVDSKWVVNGLEIVPVLLLLLFSIALSIGMGIVVLLIRRAQSKPRLVGDNPSMGQDAPSAAPRNNTNGSFCVFRRPACWLAVKSRSLAAVQAALGLRHTKPCSWVEGLTGDEKLFIAPPVKGWILVVGSGLPEPSEDVDVCFRFLMELSRKLGQVQFFCANRVVHHHAWVRLDGGKVVRAYAWGGRTLWRQGKLTAAEQQLDLKCYDYTEPPERTSFGQPDLMALNVEKVPLLAARWSLDPARIDARFLQSERGVAGEPSRIY